MLTNFCTTMLTKFKIRVESATIILKLTWVDGNSHIWIDTGNRGKTGAYKSRRSHSAPPFYQDKKKFLPRASLQEPQQEITETVHDVSILPETRAVRRLQHSAEAISAWNFHSRHPSM